MSKRSTKVAVSLPQDLYRAVERARKQSRRNRSTVVQDALRYWLKQQEQPTLIESCQAGYRKHPEGKNEVEAARATAVRSLAAEEW